MRCLRTERTASYYADGKTLHNESSPSWFRLVSVRIENQHVPAIRSTEARFAKPTEIVRWVGRRVHARERAVFARNRKQGLVAAVDYSGVSVCVHRYRRQQGFSRSVRQPDTEWIPAFSRPNISSMFRSGLASSCMAPPCGHQEGSG